MAQSDMNNAKIKRKDEFYTQYDDIEEEMNAYIEYDKDVFRGKTVLLPCDDPEWSNFTRYFAANFDRLGLKKLISTSYAKGASNKQISIFELNSPQYNKEKHDTKGRIFILEHGISDTKSINIDDLQFDYLDDDGDFRSEEVKKLRDEADIIITNPPFSLFRNFIEWVFAANKKFIILGNMNDATDLDIFPLIMQNKMWTGNCFNKTLTFAMAEDYEAKTDERDRLGRKLGKVPSITWYTNVDFGKRHEIPKLTTMADNLKYNKKLRKKCEEDWKKYEYPHFDNYDALEVPFVEVIPSDYDGIMGVPVSFLGSYNPEYFEIVGTVSAAKNSDSLNTGKSYSDYKGFYQDGRPNGRTGSTFGKCPVLVKDDGVHPYYEKDGIRVQATFPRIFIKHKKG